MDILNLDDVVVPKRSITLHGVRHPVEPQSVEGFIKSVRALQELEKKADSTDVVAQFELSMDAITFSVPTLTRDMLGKLTLEQLGKINRFLRGEFDQTAEAEPTQAGEQKKSAS